MSTNKYANLPDIDTAPDVYETEDVFPTSQLNGDSSDDEPTGVSRIRGRGADGAGAPGREEIDNSPNMNTEEARQKFRKADRKHRHKTYFSYPRSRTPSTSPSSSRTPSPSRSRPHPSRLPLASRLRLLQSELTALETELADPSNPKFKSQDVDPGEMIRGLVDVKARIEAVRRGREGRGRLVGVLVDDTEEKVESDDEDQGGKDKKEKEKQGKLDVRGVVEMDKRVGELERLVGSSSTTLDETAPLPPALLPLLTRINTQLTLLTQPRHIDSISRRLKLLLSDLERVSSASSAQAQKRASSNGTGTAAVVGAHDNLLPLLTRLAPSLPHIPHILTRLRTLSALHASAAEFQGTITTLEEEQRRTREALDALNGAVAEVESSLEANRGTVSGNVKGLENRIENVVNRLEDLAK